jgi:hypothetical protein
MYYNNNNNNNNACTALNAVNSLLPGADHHEIIKLLQSTER